MKQWREILLGPSYFFHQYLIKSSYKWKTHELEKYLAQKKVYLCSNQGIVEKNRVNTQPLNLFDNLITKRVTTGGSTGTPFEFRQDLFFTRQKERAYLFDIWREIGYSPFDLRVVLRGNINKKLISYNRLENAFFISPNKLTNENRDRVISFLSKLTPFFLHVYPSSLLKFIEYIGVSNFKNLRIRGVFAGSEAFLVEQMKNISNEFNNLKIAHWYGHSEYAVLAKYCSYCSGFHFYPTYGLAEFEKREDGLYNIIATSYNKFGTKFVRYNTEDLAKIDGTKCKNCFFPRVSAIIGREQEFFFDKQGEKHAFGPFLFGIHGQFWFKIRNIQFVHYRKGALRVFIILSNISDSVWVTNYLKTRFSSLVDLEIVFAQKIEKLQNDKHRYFVSNVSEK